MLLLLVSLALLLALLLSILRIALACDGQVLLVYLWALRWVDIANVPTFWL